MNKREVSSRILEFVDDNVSNLPYSDVEYEEGLKRNIKHFF